VIKTMADYKYMPLKWSHSLSTSLKEIMLFNVLDSSWKHTNINQSQEGFHNEIKKWNHMTKPIGDENI
jgi:hypothetical protein